MKPRPFLTATFSVLLLTACHKKDTVISKTELLTNGSWKVTGVVSDDDGNGTYETDDFSAFPVCFKDNYYTFHSNGDLEFNEGPTKCDPADPQTDVTNWKLINNETTLVIDTDPYSIEQLDNQTLKIKESLGGNRSTQTTFTKR